MDIFDGIKISKEDAKAIIQVLQKGMINLSDRIEEAELKTQGSEDHEQEINFENEEELRMEFDESKRLNEILKEATENVGQTKDPGNLERGSGTGSQ